MSASQFRSSAAARTRPVVLGGLLAAVALGGLGWAMGVRLRPSVPRPGARPATPVVASAPTLDSDVDRTRRYLDSTQADADRAAIRRHLRVRRDSIYQRFQNAARSMESLSMGPIVEGPARRLASALLDASTPLARRMPVYAVLRDLWTIPATIDLGGETDPSFWDRVSWGPVGRIVLDIRSSLDRFLPQFHVLGPGDPEGLDPFFWLLRQPSQPRYMLAAGPVYSHQNRLVRVGLLRDLPWVESIELDMSMNSVVGQGDRVELVVEGRGMGVHVQLDIVINGRWRLRIFPRHAVIHSPSSLGDVMPLATRLQGKSATHRLGVIVPVALFESRANRLRIEFTPASAGVADMMTLYPIAVTAVGARRRLEETGLERARRLDTSGESTRSTSAASTIDDHPGQTHGPRAR